VAFEDLGDWAELGGLKLPIGGKVYAVPPVSAELGPRLQVVVGAGIDVARGNEVADDNQKILDDLGELALYRDILGPVYDEMVADGVPWPALKHAAMTVMIDSATDRETAERFWQNLGKPKPARKRPADRLPPKDPKVTEIRTRRASTAGTTPRKKPAARASSGSRSSSTGA
jgi:hypothetical protein